MKFLLIVLAVQLVVEIMTRKGNKSKVQQCEGMNSQVRHPAEFELR